MHSEGSVDWKAETENQTLGLLQKANTFIDLSGFDHMKEGLNCRRRVHSITSPKLSESQELHLKHLTRRKQRRCVDAALQWCMFILFHFRI